MCDIVTGEAMEFWKHFVLVYRILCTKCIMYYFVVAICRRTERLFGKDFITPNMQDEFVTISDKTNLLAVKSILRYRFVEKTWLPTSRNQTDPVPRSSLLTSYWYYNKA